MEAPRGIELHDTDPQAQHDTVLEVSLPCRTCGYNLRGLRRDGRCPECGTPVVQSTSGDSLRYVPRAWLRRVEFGAAIAANSLIGEVIAVILAAVAAESRVSVWFLLVLVGAPFVALLSGLWLYATPEGGRLEPRMCPRWRIRAGVVATALTVGLFAAAAWAPFRWSASIGTLVLAVLGGPFGVAGLITMRSFASYAMDLARRAGDEELRRDASLCARVCSVLWLVFASALASGSLAVPLVVIFGVGAAIAFAFLGVTLVRIPARVIVRFRERQQRPS